MPNPVLYHNPRCSKSRQALALLSAEDAVFSVVEYLKTPLNESEISNVYKALKANDAVKCAYDMLRTKESEYKLAELSTTSSDAQVIAAIAKYPKLLERPIYMANNLAAIGRPLENIKAMIND
jgi:arsenate reductase